MPVELISAFYLDEKSSDWLIDSSVTKYICHDESAFHPGTFKPGTPKWASGFKMGNGSVVDVLGTGTVTITTRVNKRLQTLVLSYAYISFLIQGETYFQITAHNGRCVAMDTYHDIIIRFMKQILMMVWERYRT